ncbi:hypothetical protein PLICRDRAFT_557766 [Plicaturopsis crispa FD-325 SS-3]|nr:hypothetical protein PLICRDRAFT_557766 [Plicaturopsis crispa FD-325 SS-3]
MDANVVQLQSHPVPQIQRKSSEGLDKDGSFLSFKLLNKRARVRLSPQTLDLDAFPGKAHLFCVANSKGWFASAARNNGVFSLIFSPLADLRAAYNTTSPPNDEIPFTPQRTLSISSAIPNILALASSDTRLLVGLLQGQVAVFDTAQLFTPGHGEIQPLHSFQGSAPPRQIVPNPGDMPDLVAVLREQDASVEVLDVRKNELIAGWRSGNTLDTTASTLSWSPKGKQLAIGLHSGSILTFSPTGPLNQTKAHIPAPPSAPNQSVASATWLASPATFHAIYTPPHAGTVDVELKNYIVNLDSKAGEAQDVRVAAPCLPFPGIRPLGSFELVLRGWGAARYLLLVGDSASSDIGVVANLNDVWQHISMEETGTPSLPLDKDMNDTVLVGLELDLTNTASYRNTSGASGEETELPPPPVMYAYASDGTVLAWYVVNAEGSPYPGMVSVSGLGPNRPQLATGMAGAFAGSAPGSAMSITPIGTPSSAFGQLPPTSAPAPTFGQSAFGTQQQQSSAFGQSSFGQQKPASTSAFGTSSAPAFGQSSFGKPTTSAFGQPAFGQPAFGGQSAFGGQHSAFGSGTSALGSQPQQSSGSAFGQTTPSKPTSAFGSATPAPASGFGAFASAGPTKFGASGTGTGFGFGGASQPAPSQAPVEEDSMNSESTSSFGGLSLGGADSSKPAKTSPFGSGANMFGQPAQSPSPPDTSATQSSGGNVIKPAAGFGAFSNLGSSFGSAPITQPSSTETPKPASSAFGKTGFSTNQPAFGQSSFGQSSFGQSSFGRSSFGQSPSFSAAPPAAKSPPPATPSGSGGFGAFAQGGLASFGSGAAATGKSPFSGGTAFGGVQKEATVEPPQGVFGGGSFSTTEPPKAVFGDVPTTPPNNTLATPETSSSSPFAAGGSSFLAAMSKSPSPTPAPKSAFPSTGARANAVRGGSPDSAGSHSPGPASPAASPPASPVGTPAIKPPLVSPSPFQSSAPSSGSGAFGQLKTSTSGFMKPAEGFGAFGGAVNKSSPFYNPPKSEVKPVSVFATATTPPKETSAASPVFGATSKIGASNSPFGSPSPPSVSSSTSKSPAPVSGAFSAFSGAPAGFGSFGGSGKSTSFSDLLKQGGEEAKDPAKPKTNALAGSLPSPPKDRAGESSPSTSQAKTPVSVFSVTVPEETPKKAETPGYPFPETKADNGKGKEKESLHDEADKPSGDKDSSVSAHASISSISSAGSSFVQVSPTSGGRTNKADADQEDHDSVSGSDDADGEEEDVNGFLTDSSDLSSTSHSQDTGDNERGPEDNDGSDGSDDDLVSVSAPSSDPIRIPLPSKSSPNVSRSPSATPRAESELPLKSPSPPSQTESDTTVRAPSTPPRAHGSTPPGSPNGDGPSPLPPGKPFSSSSTPSPAPAATPPAFTLGLGRPSTRPARSSPLASTAPLFNAEAEAEKDAKAQAKSALAGVKPHPASPKPKFGLWSGPAPPVKTEPLADEPASTSPRSKTPPLLSSSSATPGFSLFGNKGKKPAETLTSQPSIFGGAPAASALAKPQAPTPAAKSPSADAFRGTSTPSGSVFTRPSPLGTPASVPSTVSIPAGPQTSGPSTVPVPAPQIKEPPPEEGMQLECMFLLSTLGRELEQISRLKNDIAQKLTLLGTRRIPDLDGTSLGDLRLLGEGSWSLADAPQWGVRLRQVVADIAALQAQRKAQMETVREVEGLMLKAGTRKEEIARFGKAQTDAEFTRMLKVRTLGPEHLETQSQLRRDIRVSWIFCIPLHAPCLDSHLSTGNARPCTEA